MELEWSLEWSWSGVEVELAWSGVEWDWSGVELEWSRSGVVMEMEWSWS